jgi:hypothetical protein
LVPVAAVVAIVLALPYLWLTDVKIGIQYIPSIVNGLTSTVAIIIGFSAACLAFQWKYFSKRIGILVIILFSIITPITFLYNAFVYLVFLNDFKVAIRLALTGYEFSIFTIALVLSLAFRSTYEKC